MSGKKSAYNSRQLVKNAVTRLRWVNSDKDWREVVSLYIDSNTPVATVPNLHHSDKSASITNTLCKIDGKVFSVLHYSFPVDGRQVLQITPEDPQSSMKQYRFLIAAFQKRGAVLLDNSLEICEDIIEGRKPRNRINTDG